jgi:putative heme-binding domain-containing protein
VANHVWPKLRSQRDPEILRLVHRLGARYGDRVSLAALRNEVTDPASPEPVRQAVLATLVETAPEGLADDLLHFVAAGRASAPLLTALARLGDPRTPGTLLNAFPGMTAPVRAAAIDALTSRSAWAHDLLEALRQGRINRADVTPLQARQIQQLGDAKLGVMLENVWGRASPTSAETTAALQRWRGLLPPAFLAQGSRTHGRTLFQQRCAACHVLFGEGRGVGPDLTGSGRHDLEYLLINLIDPNATIPADYRLAVVKLRNGQVLSGTLASSSGDPLVLRTLTEEHSLPRASVANVEVLPVSLMPAGLLDDLEPAAARDLISYLMTGTAPSP